MYKLRKLKVKTISSSPTFSQNELNLFFRFFSTFSGKVSRVLSSFKMSAETVNPGSKIKTDWYQTETHVVVEVRLKSAEGKESLKTVIFLIQVFCTTVVNSSGFKPVLSRERNKKSYLGYFRRICRFHPNLT